MNQYNPWPEGTLHSGGNSWIPDGANGYRQVDHRQYNPAPYAPGYGQNPAGPPSSGPATPPASTNPSLGARAGLGTGGQGYSFEEARRIQQQQQQQAQSNYAQQMTQQTRNYQQYQAGLGNPNPGLTNSSYQQPQGVKPPYSGPSGIGNPTTPGGTNWNRGNAALNPTSPGGQNYQQPQQGSRFNQPGAIATTPGGSNWNASYGSTPQAPNQRIGTSPPQQFTTMPTNPTSGTPTSPQNPYDSAPRPGQSIMQPGGFDQYKQSLLDWQAQQPPRAGSQYNQPGAVLGTPWGAGRDNSGQPLPGGNTQAAPGATSPQSGSYNSGGWSMPRIGQSQPGGTGAGGAPTREALQGLGNYTGPVAGGQYAVSQNGYGTQVFDSRESAGQWQRANPVYGGNQPQQANPTTPGPQIYPGVNAPPPPTPPWQGGYPGAPTTQQPQVIQAPLTQDNYNGQFNAGFQNNNGVLSPIPGYQNPATSPNAPLATAPNTPVYGQPATGQPGAPGTPGTGGPSVPGGGLGGGSGYGGYAGYPPPAPNVTVPQVNLQAPQQVNLDNGLPSMYDEQGRAIMPGGTTPNRLTVPLITEQQQNQQINQITGQNATNYATQMQELNENLAARGLSPDSAASSGVQNRLSLNRALADTQAATNIPIQTQQANAGYLLQAAGVDAQNRGLGIQSYDSLVRAMQGQDSLGIQAAAQNNNALDNYQGRGLQYAGLGLQGQQLGLQGYQAQNDAVNQYLNQLSQQRNLDIQDRSLGLNSYQAYQQAQNQYYNLLNQSRNTDINAYQSVNQNNLGLAQLLQQYV